MTTGDHRPAADAEPRYSIFTEEWHASRLRLARLRDTRQADALRALFSALVEGWDTVRPLQLLAERNGDSPDPLERQLLTFIRADLVDVYRGVAYGCVCLVPLEDGSRREPPGVDNLLAETGRFMRYVLLLGLAAHHGSVCAPIRRAALDASAVLPRWAAEFAPLLERVGDYWEGPRSGRSRPT